MVYWYFSINNNNINVNNNPTPFLIGISYIGDSLLTLDIASGGTPISYIWNTGDTVSSINAVSNGQYWAIATDINGCVSDTAYYFVNSHPTLDVIDLSYTFKVYPNPTNGLVHIEIANYIGNAWTEVYDISGKLVIRSTAQNIDLSPYERGTYMFNINYANRTKIIRVIKH